VTESATGARLREAFEAIAPPACEYLGQWTYARPFAVRAATNERLRVLQRLMARCARHLAQHRADWRHLIALPDRAEEMLAMAERHPYRLGTYRTDFLLDSAWQPRLIEITSRFAMNAYLPTGFYRRLAAPFVAAHPDCDPVDDFAAFFDGLAGYFGVFDHVCLLKGADQRNGTKWVAALFEQAGYPVYVIPAAEVPANLALLDNAAVIGEMDQAEWCAQPDDAVQALVASNMLNDLRTVFLLHDKRFFALLNDEEFQRAALSPDEIAIWRQHLVPTYAHGQRPDLWERARCAKDAWIAKPRNAGKSIGVVAGPLVSAAAWEDLFSSPRLPDMVLQQWVDQPRVSGSIGETAYEDYVAGTLMFFEDGYYGPGHFRASSHPVTNVVDDRKIAPLVVRGAPPPGCPVI